MSIADKITRLQTAKANIAAAITNKGGTVTSGDGFEDFATDIGTIPSSETLDEYGLPPKDTGYDWHTNNALYLVFDNKAEPNTNEQATYGIESQIEYNPSGLTVTVGIMEGSVYVPKKTIEKVSGVYPNGLMSEFTERWVVVRIVGNLTRFYGSDSACWVAVYGRMTTLTEMSRIIQNYNNYSIKSYEIEGATNITVPPGGSIPSLRRFALNFASGSTMNFNQFLTNCGSLNSVDVSIPSDAIITRFGTSFQNSRFLETLDLSNWGDVSTIISSNFGSVFRNCNIKTLNLDGWDLAGLTASNYSFMNMYRLTNFTSPIFYCSISFSDSTLLTHDSLMSIINNLATVSTTQTLTLGSTNLAKLTSEEIAIATNKGWTVA